MLAIDCSLRRTNIAVFDGASEGGKMLASFCADIGREQARKMPDIVQNLLDEARVKASEISLVAATNGPGYFTGVRVGVAFAAAFAFGVHAKIVPVGTLDMLMFEYKTPVIATVYAGVGRVYVASKNLQKNVPVGDYDENYIRGLAGSLDVDLVANAVPRPESLAWLAWETRARAIEPRDLRVNWCRNPV